MGRKVIKGVAKRYNVTGSSPTGYRPVWDTGRASYHKRITRVAGINRPST